MSPKKYSNLLKTVTRANFPRFPHIFPLPKKLSTKSKIIIKEYVCQVSSKSLENCDLYTGLTDIQTSDERKNSRLVESETLFASLAQSKNGDISRKFITCVFSVC